MISDISIDHAEILGPTLKDIAREKAGIIKPGVPMLAGVLPALAGKVIRARCREMGSPYLPLRPQDYRLNQAENSLACHLDGLRFRRLEPSLPGNHQLRNCALVLKAVGVLREGGFKISKSEIKHGLESTSWPGRFQVMRNGSSSPTIVLDVCHNAGGTAAFVDTFKRTFPGRRAQTIIGFVRRKPHQELVDLLAGVTAQFWLVPLASRRSVDTAELERCLDWKGVPVRRLGRLGTACAKLQKQVNADDIVAVIGSHYLVGEYLGKYGRK